MKTLTVHGQRVYDAQGGRPRLEQPRAAMEAREKTEERPEGDGRCSTQTRTRHKAPARGSPDDLERGFCFAGTCSAAFMPCLPVVTNNS